MLLMTQTPDPRQQRDLRHALVVVLTLAVGAVTTGARLLTGIGEWAHDVSAELLDPVGLAGTVPSEATHPAGHRSPRRWRVQPVVRRLDASLLAAGRRARGARAPRQDRRRAHNLGARPPHLVAALTHDTDS